jgi:hypothetical protein
MTADNPSRWRDDPPGGSRAAHPSRPPVTRPPVTRAPVTRPAVTGQAARMRPARKAAIGAGLAAYSWVAGATVPFSVDALLSVLLPGAVIAAVAYRFPPERIAPPDPMDAIGFSYWAICIAALFEWEAAAVRDNSPPWHPSLTELVNPLIHPHPLKSAAVLIWLLAGWALVGRLSQDEHPDHHDCRLRLPDRRPGRSGGHRPAADHAHSDPRRVAGLCHAPAGRTPVHPARLALARLALLRPVGPADGFAR